MRVTQTMTEKLTQALNPALLEIEDESARHAGHSGARAGGESHFNIRIVSTLFEGHSRVARQRLAYGILAAELAGPVHALSLTLATPNEAATR